jgi:energy-coupling factor transporter transmembrane protein EcfT
MSETIRLSGPTEPRGKTVFFLGYCVLVSAVVIAWYGHDPTSDLWRLVALGCVVLLSVVLCRLLPGWGFAGPAVLALAWLVVILATTPSPLGGDGPAVWAWTGDI